MALAGVSSSGTGSWPRSSPTDVATRSANPTSGTASVWVRVPKITGNARQELKLFWGKPDAKPESSGKAVFNESNGYLSVWHMGADVKDEVGTLESKDTGTSVTNGIIGQARHFPGKAGIFVDSTTEDRARLWQARHHAFYAAVALRPGCKPWTTDVCVPISHYARVVLETRADVQAAGILAAMRHTASAFLATFLMCAPAAAGDMAGAADGQRADGNAGRHLHDRQQRVLALQRRALDRHAEHGQRGHRGGHARQVGGPAGAGDDHLQAAALGGRGVAHHALGRSMGGDDARLVRHAQRRQGLGGVAHGRPVGLAPHDHADSRFRLWGALLFIRSFLGHASGDDIGNQLAFEPNYLVLQAELALLQPLELQLVERRLLDQAVDHLVEVAVLAFQRLQPGLDRFGVQRDGSVVVAHRRPGMYPFGRVQGSFTRMSDFLPHPFWNFSLETYAADGVAEACLDLQDRRGCDVNILLFCCWLGASGRPTLTADRLRTVLRVSDEWQAEIVKPLRQVRRLLKDKAWAATLPETVDAARRRVADAELAAEHAEQLKLASLYNPPADRDRPAEKRLRAAVGNLGVYAVCLGVVPDAKDRAAVATLMRATFPGLLPEEIAKVVGA